MPLRFCANAACAVDEHQLNYKQPLRLCYKEQSGQLMIGFYEGVVAVFDVLKR